jgi:tetratricopeptide (TPR) repeat protein
MEAQQKLENLKEEIISLKEIIENNISKNEVRFKKQQKKAKLVIIIVLILYVGIILYIFFFDSFNKPKYMDNSNIPIISMDELLHANTDYQTYFLDQLIYADKIDSAINVANSILKIEPKNDKIINMLGKAYQYNKNIDSAFYYYNKAKTISGREDSTKYNMENLFNMALELVDKEDSMAKEHKQKTTPAKK